MSAPGTSATAYPHRNPAPPRACRSLTSNPEAGARELGRALGRSRSETAGRLGGERGQPGEARDALRDRRPVARLQGGAGRHARLARERLAGPQPREDGLRAPGQAAAAVTVAFHFEDDGTCDGAEDPRTGPHVD